MAQVLGRLPRFADPNLLVATETFDDAGVYRLSDDLALVLTVDFFPPLVDDPYTFGQIAAANALSDVYAMGGQPLTALNLVGFPDQEPPAEVLYEILRGGADKVAEAGACIVGGHSVRDAEVKYGLAVTGRVHPARIVTNAAARPGDQLVLTKPIGSGVMTTAAKKGRIAPEELRETIAVMTTLNRAARDAIVECGVRAATDITGYGLIGHADEMARGGGVVLAIEAAAVPLIPGALTLAAEKFVTRAHRSTLSYVGSRLDRGGAAEDLVNVLADAQTSGGLLISVAEADCERLLAGLRSRGVEAAARIGAVEAAPEPGIRLK